jgi:SPP1 gp7 family putative phage head morphogenesis protein
MPALEQSVQIESRHAVFINRFAGGLHNQFLPFLEDMAKQLAAQLRDNPPVTEWSRKRLNNQLSDVKSLMGAVFTEYNKGLFNDLKEFSAHEAAFEAQALEKVIESKAIEVTLASDVQAFAAVTSQPLIVGDTAVLLNPFIKEWEASQVRRVQNVVRSGFFQGQTIDQMVKSISGKNGVLDKKTRASNRAVIRTATNHVSSVARETTIEENDDITTGYEWVSTLDSRTSSQCKSLDGTEFLRKDKGKEFQPKPPIHINACLAGTKITTEHGQVAIEHVKVGDKVLTHTGEFKEVYTVMARPHDGMVRDLIDGFGRSVSLTNEHPILTLSKGWLEVGDLKRRDELFYNPHKLERSNDTSGSKVTQNVLLNSHDIITEITEELISYGIFSQSRGVSSTVNLDNRTADNKISNVSSDRHLEFISKTKAIKKIYNDLLVPCRCTFERVSLRVRGFFKRGLDKARVIYCHSFAGLLAAFFTSFWVLSSPVFAAGWFYNKFSARPYGVPSVSGLNPELDTSLSNSVIREIVMSFYRPKAFSRLPVFVFNEVHDFFIGNGHYNKSPCDKWYNVSINSIVEYHYNGMVYNLAVKDDETYIANGFLVHNCRSTIAPILDKRFGLDDSDATRASKGAEGGQQVQADQTYYSWLKTQPKPFIRETLGKSRSELFLNGGLTSDEFSKLSVDKLFRPLTLDEMRAKDPMSFDSAGI